MKAVDLREKDEWVTIKPYYTLLGFVARVSARIFIGKPLCRNPEWLEISTQFTENGIVASYPFHFIANANMRSSFCISCFSSPLALVAARDRELVHAFIIQGYSVY